MAHLSCFSQSYSLPSPTWCCPSVKWHTISQAGTLSIILTIFLLSQNLIFFLLPMHKTCHARPIKNYFLPSFFISTPIFLHCFLLFHQQSPAFWSIFPLFITWPWLFILQESAQYSLVPGVLLQWLSEDLILEESLAPFLSRLTHLFTKEVHLDMH